MTKHKIRVVLMPRIRYRHFNGSRGFRVAGYRVNEVTSAPNGFMLCPPYKVGDPVYYPSPYSANYRQPVPGVVVDVWRGWVEVKPVLGGLTGRYEAHELTARRV